MDVKLEKAIRKALEKVEASGGGSLVITIEDHKVVKLTVNTETEMQITEDPT